jgi:hypothetical protein
MLAGEGVVAGEDPLRDRPQQPERPPGRLAGFIFPGRAGTFDHITDPFAHPSRGMVCSSWADVTASAQLCAVIV